MSPYFFFFSISLSLALPSLLLILVFYGTYVLNAARHLICIYFIIGFDSGIRLFFSESVSFVEIGQFYKNWVAFKVLQPASKAAAIGCLSQK